MAESSPPFLHKKQSCELIAMGFPFHVSLETVPSPSLWNTDQQSIYYHPSSLPPPEPPPIRISHGSIKKLVGLLKMGGSHLYWKLGIEISDYCAEETMIGIYLCRRFELGQLFSSISSCSKHVLWLFFSWNIFLFFRKVIHSLLVSIRDFDSELISWTIILVLDFSVRSILLVSTRDYDYIFHELHMQSWEGDRSQNVCI